MKTYNIILKGTKKHNTKDITVTVFGNNKYHAFNWAYEFFEKGILTEKTINYIPEVNNLAAFAGKYKVYRSSFKPIKN